MKVLCTILCLVFCIDFISVYGQADQNLYNTAKQYAYAGEYDQAKDILNKILLSNARHYDAQLLLAQVYAWNGEFDLSIPLLSELLQNFTPTADAYEVLARIKVWQAAYPQCLEICEAGLQLFPNQISLQLLKAQALTQMNQPDLAMDMLESVFAKDSSNIEAKQLLEQLQFQKLNNSIALEYSYAHFSNSFSPWHHASLSYRRNTIWGPVIARATNAYMFDQFGIQYELDAYPKISKKSYSYLNVGISNHHIFPKFRFGAEYFRLLPNQFEVSGGLRGLNFNQIQVIIYTAQLGHYFNHYWISARGFLSSLDNSNKMTGSFTLRRFIGNADHYLSLYATSGTTPLKIVSLNEMRRLNAQSIAIDYQYPALKRRLLMKAGAQYQQEAYEEIRFTRRYTISFSLEKRF